MKTKLKELRKFLENAHKKGVPSCAEAEEALARAKELRTEINAMIEELEQVHNVCVAPTPKNKNDDDDGFEYGV